MWHIITIIAISSITQTKSQTSNQLVLSKKWKRLFIQKICNDIYHIEILMEKKITSEPENTIFMMK